MINWAVTIAVTIVLLTTIFNDCFGQEPVFRFSQKHMIKIEEIKSAEKKLKKYKTYFHRDSVKYNRVLKKYLDLQGDSMWRAASNRSRSTKESAQSATSKLSQKIFEPWAKKQATETVDWLEEAGFHLSSTSQILLGNYFRDYFFNAAENDSLLFAIKQKMPSIKLPSQLSENLEKYEKVNQVRLPKLKLLALGKVKGINEISQFGELKNSITKNTSELNKYSQYGNIISNTDSLKGFISSQAESLALKQVSKMKGLAGLNELKGQQLSQANYLKSQFGDYQSQMEQLQDSAYIKQEAKKKAEEIATKYIADHPEVMQGIQRKTSLLMKKYSVVPNSNDLSSAIKRTSLKGKPFRQRLYVATNFQFISIDPLSIDFSPMIGYRFNSRFLTGVGGTYRQTFSDTIPTLSPDVFGYKGFTSYDVLNNFFIYGEFGRNSPGVEKFEGKTKRIWINSAFVGIGRKFRINTRLEMTMVMLYDILYQKDDSINSRPWSIRIGFQSSDLGLYKKR